MLQKSDKDKVLVIAAGVTIRETVAASATLAGLGINIRIMDPFTVKPIDKDGIIANAKECGGRIITVEDHYMEGGLGEAVLSAVSEEKGIIVKKLAVKTIPRSGPPNELLEYFGIGHRHIAEAVQSIVKM